MAKKNNKKEKKNEARNLVSIFRKDKRLWISYNPNEGQLFVGIKPENGEAIAINLTVAEALEISENLKMVATEIIKANIIPF